MVSALINAELDRLSALQPNWDRYGAPAIDPKIIEAARSFVSALPQNLAFRPRVVPMSTGNLQFEWHEGPKILEIEFEKPDSIRFLQWHPDNQVEEEDSFPIGETQKAIDLIQWFMMG